MTTEKEIQIQTAIMQFLQYQSGLKAWRMNTTGTPIGNTGRFKANPNAGMADIYCQMNVTGRPVPVWLEVKTKQRRQSKLQCQFEDAINEMGGFYFVVRSVYDVEMALKIVVEKMREYDC